METGGVRKVRWGLAGNGKRGGSRVIYYYHSERLLLFLPTAYPKNEKANLNQLFAPKKKRTHSRTIALTVPAKGHTHTRSQLPQCPSP